MLTLFKISLLFSLFLPSVHSVCEQFPTGDLLGDTVVTNGQVNEILNQAFSDRIPLGCPGTNDVGRYDILVSGRAVISHSNNDDAPVLTFNVFNVDDVNDISLRNVSYRYTSVNEVIKTCAVDSFNQFFPRERLTEGDFNPTHIFLVTWNITQSILSSGGTETSDFNSPHNIFQMAYIHHGNRALIFYLYDTIQWGRDTANVGLQACGSSPSGRWDTAPSGQVAASQSNLATTRSGEWLLYLNGTGHLTPAVVCRTGCSLTNGYCTERDTCLCKEGWSGDLCTVAICCQGCINGSCIAPDTCECNDGWLGSSCNTARCYPACINGRCNDPDVCSCRPGFEGQNCTTATCSQNCGAYGFCTRPNHCSCISGYTGGSSPCTPVCTNACLNGGNCTAPETCTCPPGLTGPICNTTIVVPSSTSTSSSTVVSMTMTESPSPSMTEPTTDEPTDGATTATAGSQLSSSTIGAIVGGIVALVVVVVIIAVIIIVAAISC